MRGFSFFFLDLEAREKNVLELRIFKLGTRSKATEKNRPDHNSD